LTLGGTIWLDTDAAGYGWFLDGTPEDDAEFTIALREGERRAENGSSAAGRMDLLTVVMHELGHVLGLADLRSAGSRGDLMYETLPTGVRRASAGFVVEREIAHGGVGRHNSRAARVDRFWFSDWFLDWFGQIGS
jgi:hypothetical protein